MRVEKIPTSEARPWILAKHYAHRMPCVQYAFGLFDGNEIVGVSTFGLAPNFMECKMWEPFVCLELNRLVIDIQKKNSGSFFVSRSLNLLPKPSVVISYADTEMNHIGYIYQATNWIYTGIGSVGEKRLIMIDGSTKHQRHYPTTDKSQIERIEKTKGKHRYYYFNGNKTEIKDMKKILRYPVLPYPKGKTKRYDASTKIATQRVLFT